jgi:tetratricopeptide (TPR) repeat protein
MTVRALVVAAIAMALAGAGSAAAQTPAEPAADARAERLNDQGKSLFSDRHDYAAAAEKFRQAIAITPDARYYYNLCAALEKLGQVEPALEACEEVFQHSPRPDLGTKAGKKAADLRRQQREGQRPPPPYDTTTPETTPDHPPPTTPPPTSTGTGGGEPLVPPEEAAPAETTPEPEPLKYRFGLGADLGLVHNSSVGASDFGRTGLQVRLHGSALLFPRANIGLEGYLHISSFGERMDVATSVPLSLFDLGVAAYWHTRLWRSLYLTPAGGLCFSFITTHPGDTTDTYATAGLRLEASLEWVFGNGAHAIKVTPLGLSYYAGAFGQISGFAQDDARVFGLDKGGVTWAFTVGYTYRFTGGPYPGWNLE